MVLYAGVGTEVIYDESIFIVGPKEETKVWLPSMPTAGGMETLIF